MRIVSLLPSATEIVAALGHGAALVGRSHECDFPAAVTALPACSRAKLEPGLSSRAIDARIRDIVARGLSVYEVDAELLRRLRPELIVTQTQCEVCAVGEAELTAAVGEWTGTRPAIVSTSAATLDGVWDDIRAVAAALGDGAAGERLVGSLQGRMRALEDRLADARTRPRVACLEWLEPLMAAGNWVPRLVEMAGGEDVLGHVDAASHWIDWPALVEADPEVIAVMPCGFDIARSRREMMALAARPDWPKLAAVRAGRVYLTDGNRYFNRPGPRLVESLEILAELLHPDHIEARHMGDGWEPL
jgi:iron complex transport system substrate-binding protein